MNVLKKGIWLFSTIVWETFTRYLDRVGLIEKKEIVVITCPMEDHPEPPPLRA